MSSWVADVDDCQGFSSKAKWMKRQCQRLMCLMARRVRGTTTGYYCIVLEIAKRICKTILKGSSLLSANRPCSVDGYESYKRLYLVVFSLLPSLFWKLRDKRNV